MIVNMTGGGSGGAALNFKVVPGLTQPGTALENTIWVKTEQIGAWYFSATQPENMQEWDVWFTVGTSSAVEFSALKKNGIQGYPISAKQYVNGAWVDKTAKSYQGGKWVEWIVNLFPPTSGWQFGSFNSGYNLGTCKFDGDVFTASVKNHETASIYKNIDLTEIDTIIIDFKTTLRNTNYGGIVTYVRTTLTAEDSIAFTRASDSELLTGTISMDVSALDGERLVIVGGDCWHDDGAHTFEVYSVRSKKK